LRYSKELYGVSSKVRGNVRVRILANRTIHKRRKIRLAYLRAIALAEQRIWITNSYFLPDPVLIRALLRAARRGVEIKIIMGGSASDVPWVGFAARAIYGNFLRRGIKLYEWKGRVLHSKTAVVDGIWSTVGSYNLDYRSLLHNLEVNAGIMDKAFGEMMENMFCDDLLNADLIQYEVWQKRSWWNHVRDRIAYRLRFFL
jgi:cardiolipin synthase